MGGIILVGFVNLKVINDILSLVGLYDLFGIMYINLIFWMKVEDC